MLRTVPVFLLYIDLTRNRNWYFAFKQMLESGTASAALEMCLL